MHDFQFQKKIRKSAFFRVFTRSYRENEVCNFEGYKNQL